MHILPELWQASAVRRGDMNARTIIAKMVAVLFVRAPVRSHTKFTQCTGAFTRYELKDLYVFFVSSSRFLNSRL